MAKTKQVLHAYIEQGGNGSWWIYAEDDHGWSAKMPLDATPETEAAAIRELKDSAFVWGFSHLDLQDVDGDTIQNIALSVTPSRRDRLRVIVEHDEFPPLKNEVEIRRWIRVHRLAYRLEVLPMWKIRTIEQRIPSWDWSAAV